MQKVQWLLVLVLLTVVVVVWAVQVVKTEQQAPQMKREQEKMLYLAPLLGELQKKLSGRCLQPLRPAA